MRNGSLRNSLADLSVLVLTMTCLGFGLVREYDTRVEPSLARGCASKTARSVEMPPPLPVGTADYIVTVNGNLQWLVNGVVNPTLTLTRGETYLFDLTAFGDEHPFVINSNQFNPFGTVYAGPSHSLVLSFTPSAVMPATIYYHCDVHYSSMAGAINLGNPPQCTGDLNADQLVNITDFGILTNAFGAACSNCPADINGDDVVNVADFGLFVNAFGGGCS